MAPRPTATVFHHVRPDAGRTTDLVAVDGVLVDRVPPGAAVHHVNGDGRLALPTLVDTHVHPDKTAWGEPWQSRTPASGIEEYCRADVELYKKLRTPLKERALRLMSHAATQGTRAMRAHADVAPAFGLEGVEGLAHARDELKGILDVQIVAFPQHGVQRLDGVAELLEEAASSGLVQFIGGIDPVSFDGDQDGQLDTVFGIAERHGIGLDIHLHDTGAPGLGPLGAIIDRTKALGLQGKVTVSHCFCVAALSGGELDAMADRLAEARIDLTTVATAPTKILPYRRLAERGVRVGLGSDGVRDSWSPFGNADMLHRAWLAGWAQRVREDKDIASCFDLAADGARLVDLPKIDFKPGSPADFMLVEGECVPQVVIDQPRRDVIVRGGRVVARDGWLVKGDGAEHAAAPASKDGCPATTHRT